METKVLGLDIDGTLSDSWTKAVYDSLVYEYGEARSYDKFWAADKRHEEYPKQLWENLVRDYTLFSKYAVNPEVPKTIRGLSEKYEIVYITHREDELRFHTFWWLKSNGFPNYDNFHLSSIPKTETVRQYNCKYYVEDRPAIIESLKNITNVIVKRQSYNCQIAGLPVIDSIMELPNLLEKLENESS